MHDFSLQSFKSTDGADDDAALIAPLVAFDSIPQMQQLKAIARDRMAPAPGVRLLDVGCGFGLETVRLAPDTQPGGHVAGIDVSPDFIAQARRRATAADLDIDYRVGDAQDLPYSDGTFDAVRAERMLMYLKDFPKAVRELHRVLKPGGRLALIEADFSTTTVNFPDRDLMRKVLDHEITSAVVSSWLPGPLRSALEQTGFAEIEVESRVAIFPQDLGAKYFGSLGPHAADAGVISADEAVLWQEGIAALARDRALFGSVGYFLFTAVK